MWEKWEKSEISHFKRGLLISRNAKNGGGAEKLASYVKTNPIVSKR
jgi:hypothetical protein